MPLMIMQCLLPIFDEQGLKQPCEDCKKVSRNYGLVNEGRVRWCCQCAKKHKGVLLYQYFKQQAAKA